MCPLRIPFGVDLLQTVSHLLQCPLAQRLSTPYSSSDQLINASNPAGPTTRKRKSPPDTHMVSLPKRTRVDSSSLRINGKLLQPFQSRHASFRTMLMQNDRAYFDRTRYISVLENLSDVILFCRPGQFGKSLTISMLEHFHGLQYADEHQTFYQVCGLLDYLDIENLLLFQSL
jgi:Predicted AAA-ATPase